MLDGWILLIAATIRLADTIIQFVGRRSKNGKKPPPTDSDGR